MNLDNVRNWLFLPKLKFDNIDGLNKHLKQKCIDLAKQRKHHEVKDKTIQVTIPPWKRHIQYIGYNFKLNNVTPIQV